MVEAACCCCSCISAKFKFPMPAISPRSDEQAPVGFGEEKG
jgi:hypothetical protein